MLNFINSLLSRSRIRITLENDNLAIVPKGLASCFLRALFLELLFALKLCEMRDLIEKTKKLLVRRATRSEQEASKQNASFLWDSWDEREILSSSESLLPSCLLLLGESQTRPNSQELAREATSEKEGRARVRERARERARRKKKQKKLAWLSGGGFLLASNRQSAGSLALWFWSKEGNCGKEEGKERTRKEGLLGALNLMTTSKPSKEQIGRVLGRWIQRKIL